MSVCRAARVRCGLVAFAAGVVACAPVGALAETLAVWRFDRAPGPCPPVLPADAGAAGVHARVPAGARIVPGKRGGALRPASPRGAAKNAGSASVRGRLELGAGDWTVECWLRLDAGAAGEGALLHVDTAAHAELFTRISVLPAENAFVVRGPATRPARDAAFAAPAVIELPNPAGPPALRARIETATLAVAPGTLPRDTWFHVAIVHERAAGEVRLFLDGQPRAVAALALDPLPFEKNGVSLGAGWDGRAVLHGAIDELRVSDIVVYQRAFAPPTGFASGQVNAEAR